MPRPRASFPSRRGILSSLRRRWPLNRLEGYFSARLAHEVDRATKALRAELHDAHRATEGLRTELRAADSSVDALRARLDEIQERQRELRHRVGTVYAVLLANSAGHFERHPMARDLPEISRHATSAVAATPLSLTPTPHLVVERLLPEATYQALLDAIPPDECFRASDPIKQNFRPAQGRLVPDFTTVMWTFMENEVIPKVLVPALMGRLRPHIDGVYGDRYGERGPAVSALPHEATAGRLMLRRPGYHLDPHVDPRRVVVTCLLYLARPGDSPQFGTQFFSLNAVPTVSGTKTYYPERAGYVSTLEKTVPFTPNTAVAFINAGAAAHGATIPKETPADTKRYAYQFYVSPNLAGLASIIGEEADESRD